MRVLTAKGAEYGQISDIARQRLAFLDDGRLLIAKTYTLDAQVRSFISKLKHKNIAFNIQHADLSVIASYYNQAEAEKKEGDHSDMQKAAKVLFQKAVEERASDIHIRVTKRENTQILFRIHNDLEFKFEHAFDYGEQLATAIYQAMADVSDSTFEPRSRQGARISETSKLAETLDGIRIATGPLADGFLMVLRLLYNDASADLSLSSLGFHQSQIDAVEYMKKRPTGVITIGGPTGSGKSTTLQRVLGSIIEETGGRKHIITVEDPPEYPVVGACQMPVTNANTEEERSEEYQSAIKATMRMDPDIIMLSEVRDHPTARLVIQAAMTGHQVWTTVHANSGLAIINRLMDLGVDAELLTDPSLVAGLICQRLVKQLCPQCKKPLSKYIDTFEPRDVERFERALDISKVFIQGSGCPHCRNSGIIGRTVVAETIVTDNTLMKFIKDGDRIGAINYIRQDQNVISMLGHAIIKINQGIVDPFQAESVVGLLSSDYIERDHRVSQHELKVAH